MDLTEMRFNINKISVKDSPYDWLSGFTKEFTNLTWFRKLQEVVSLLIFDGTEPRRILKMYVLALDSDGKQSTRKMRGLT